MQDIHLIASSVTISAELSWLCNRALDSDHNKSHTQGKYPKVHTLPTQCLSASDSTIYNTPLQAHTEDPVIHMMLLSPMCGKASRKVGEKWVGWRPPTFQLAYFWQKMCGNCEPVWTGAYIDMNRGLYCLLTLHNHNKGCRDIRPFGLQW